MNIKQCIFTSTFEEEVKTIRVTYEDGFQSFHTFNLDDPVVSEIVSKAGGVDQIESNTRKVARQEEKEAKLYEKFKKHMEVSDDLSFIFTKSFNQEELFNLKIWLFEKPEVENCQDLELKTKLRTASNLIDIIGLYYLMTKSS